MLLCLHGLHSLHLASDSPGSPLPGTSKVQAGLRLLAVFDACTEMTAIDCRLHDRTSCRYHGRCYPIQPHQTTVALLAVHKLTRNQSTRVSQGTKKTSVARAVTRHATCIACNAC